MSTRMNDNEDLDSDLEDNIDLISINEDNGCDLMDDNGCDNIWNLLVFLDDLLWGFVSQ
jgi:hypothetical protein